MLKEQFDTILIDKFHIDADKVTSMDFYLDSLDYVMLIDYIADDIGIDLNPRDESFIMHNDYDSILSYLGELSD